MLKSMRTAERGNAGVTQREEQILQWIRENPMISQEALAARAGITRSSVAVHIVNLMKKGKIAGRGYILNPNRYVVVVGAANLDIGGKSLAPLVARDSNPGQVTVSLGGVGRNIAHNLRLLGVRTNLITALGEDAHAEQLVASCRNLGIDLSGARRVPGGRTSTYVFLSDADGDMALAVSDMAIYEALTPDYLAQQLGVLNGAALVVVDANLREDALAYLGEHCTAPLFLDPVSVVKAEKVRGLLGKLHTLKPNRLEAELLSGVPITDRASLEQAAQTLLATGLRRVFLSLGKDGVFAAEEGESVWLSCCPAQVRNTTGGGDAFTAALAWAFLEGESLTDSARLANAAAALAVEGEETINPLLSPEAVFHKLEEQEENP